MKIQLRGNDLNEAHADTRAVRWSDLRTCNSLTTTQVWKWRGGDAIVVLANDPYSRLPKSYVVIRKGKKVQVIEGALHDALLATGTEKYTIS
jgi:hypothetical protein